MALRIGFQVWAQRVSWPELMEAGRAIDAAGFDELWSNDHVLPVAPGRDRPVEGLDGPIFEGWGVLFGWAATTSRVRLGCLVSAAGYRNPALLVRTATALDHASGGRAVLGLGAGWARREHETIGVELPDAPAERLDRLEEAAAICRDLLDGRVSGRSGRWWSTSGARNDPPPMGPLPLLIGGSGPRRTLPIVARYADAWSADGDDPESFRRRSQLLDERAAEAGRDPGAIERTVGLPPPLVRPSRAAAVDVLAGVLAEHGTPAGDAVDVARSSPFAAPIDAVEDTLRAYEDAGAQAVMFDWPAPFDAATLEALAALRERFAGR